MEASANAKKIRVATVTLSDTRTPADDEGGNLLRALLAGAGFELRGHAIVREETEAMRVHVSTLALDDAVDAIVLTGGTGIAPRDRTIEAIAPLLEKTLDGFGEAFRRLSWDEIGPNAILSRALAGTLNGRVVVALPGSPKAVRLAVEKLLGPVLAHAVGLASGKGGHHPHRASTGGAGGAGGAGGGRKGSAGIAGGEG
ncbi:MAG: molybdenum cofactor biosynthesis protein B [Polyangiaceae bacterium]